MSITTKDDFFNNYLVSNGELGNETVLNRPTGQLKIELDCVNNVIEAIRGDNEQEYDELLTYEKCDIVKYQDEFWISNVAGNTSTPGEDSNWDHLNIELLYSLIEKPIILAPSDGVVDFNGSIETSDFITDDLFIGTHDYSLWELATDSDFTNVVVTNQTTTDLTSWVPTVGGSETTYFARVRYGSDVFRSKWSNSISFTTPPVNIDTPTIGIEGYPDYAVPNPILTASAFITLGSTDTHESTDWRIYHGNTVVWSSLADTVNKTTIAVPYGILEENTEYKVTVIYNGTNTGSSNTGIEYFTTAVDFISLVTTPTVSVTGQPSSIPEQPEISTSAFESSEPGDTHYSTSWYIKQAGLVIWSSEDNTTDLTSITVPAGILVQSTQYTFEAIHSTVDYSSDVGSVQGTTSAYFTPAPTVSGSSSYNELANAQLTITNYNASATYTISVSHGSYTRNADVITWTLPAVSSDTAASLSIYAIVDGFISPTTSKNITIVNIPTAGDETIQTVDYSADFACGEGYIYI